MRTIGTLTNECMLFDCFEKRQLEDTRACSACCVVTETFGAHCASKKIVKSSRFNRKFPEEIREESHEEKSVIERK